MEILELIEAGEKLGLQGAQLKAWAEAQAERRRVERAQAHEFQCKVLIAQREAALRRLELKRQSCSTGMRMVERQLPTFQQELRTEDVHASRLMLDRSSADKSGRLILGRGVQCDDHVEHAQLVHAGVPSQHKGKYKDFMCPEMLISEHEQPFGNSPTRKEVAELKCDRTVVPIRITHKMSHVSDIHNAYDEYITLYNSDTYHSKIESQADASCSNAPHGVVMSTTSSCERGVESLHEHEVVHVLPSNLDSSADDLAGSNETHSISSKVGEIAPSRVSEWHHEEADETVCQNDGCVFNEVYDTRCSQIGCRCSILVSDALFAELKLQRKDPVPNTRKAYNASTGTSRCRKEMAEPFMFDRGEQTENGWKRRKCKKETCFSQRDWNADGRQKSAHRRCYLKALASQGQPLWWESAHRKFVRHKTSALFMGPSIAGAENLKCYTLAVLIYALREHFLRKQMHC